MKLTYNGVEERMFPVLGATLSQGDEIDAPEGFIHSDFSVSGKVSAKPTLSVIADATVGE